MSQHAPWVAQHGLRYPYGLCQCGCGQKAPLATYTDHRRGTLKGHPGRFIAKHGAKVVNEMKYATLQEAFDAQVQKGSRQECWDARSCFGSGYGRINFQGDSLYAHRVSFELYKGVLPAGMLVCHTCDRRQCANPDHLFAGSNRDNMADMVQKGRQARGEGHGAYKHGRYVGQPRQQGYRSFLTGLRRGSR